MFMPKLQHRHYGIVSFGKKTIIQSRSFGTKSKPVLAARLPERAGQAEYSNGRNQNPKQVSYLLF